MIALETVPAPTRSFAVGSYTFSVATNHDADRVLVEELFRDVPPPASPGAPTVVFSLLRPNLHDDNAWMLRGARVQDGPALTVDGALNLLMSEINRGALDADPDYLHLHAAVATKEGRAVVIAAAHNTGKTTTVAHLVARGWAFVTDETARLSGGTDEVGGFPKPLAVKPGGREDLRHWEPWMVPPVRDGLDGFRFVPVSASGASISSGGSPHLVVLLRRPQGTEAITGAEVRRLHPADAVVALMQETFDAERFGAAAVRLATLAAASHCFEVTRATPTETADQLETLFSLDPVEPLEVRPLPRSAAFSRGVASIGVGDRTVVHDDASGRILAFDAGAARVWEQLGGWGTQDDVDLRGPVIDAFVAQLRGLGLLAASA